MPQFVATEGDFEILSFNKAGTDVPRQFMRLYGQPNEDGNFPFSDHEAQAVTDTAPYAVGFNDVAFRTGYVRGATGEVVING